MSGRKGTRNILHRASMIFDKKWEENRLKSEFLFGAAYYPEYMPDRRLEKDMQMMKEAGMNVLRIAESTWSTLEPREGTFDFSYIDSVLDMAEKNSINIIIGTPTYAIPSWLEKKDPEVMVETKSGREAYGRRQLINLLNPTFRRHAEQVIRILVEHTAGRNCVIGYQIDNETKHYGNMGKEMQEGFLQYLKDKFQTTERLNQTFGLAYWSNSIDSWDAFPDMKGCIHGGLAGEFACFQRKIAADYLAWQAELVTKYKRQDQFITHNMDFEWKKFGADIAQDGYSYGVQPDICHAEAAKAVTLAGTDIYHPGQDFLTGKEIAFCGDSIRSLKKDNYLVLECQAQAFKYWTPYPGQLRLQAYSHLASGAAGLLYWNWHSIHNGYETYWKGLLSHDLQKNPTFEEACMIGSEWKQLAEKLCGMKKQNAVALVVDNRSLTALEWFPIDRNLSYNDVVRWMYDNLYEMNIECDVVDVQSLETEKYRMIITPALYSASEELLASLEKFVQQGGVLVSSFKSFVSNEYLQVYSDTQPHRLHTCFGMSYNQFTEPGRTTLHGHPVSYFAELLNLQGAESLGSYGHRYWGKYSGMTKCSFGKGKAYYIGCYTSGEVLKDLYRQAAEDAKIEVPSVQWPVVLRSGVSRKGTYLHYILHYSEDSAVISCPWKKGKELLEGKSYVQGERIELKDWDVKILEAEE